MRRLVALAAAAALAAACTTGDGADADPNTTTSKTTTTSTGTSSTAATATTAPTTASTTTASTTTASTNAPSTVPTSAAAGALADLACDGRLAVETTGTITSTEITELSGLVASRRHDDVLWVHNDSGDTARLFAIDLAGNLLGTITLDDAGSLDWEDIALGPGPDGTDHLFVGDIGDNVEARDHVVVYRLAEPEPQGDSVVAADALTLRYPDRPHNAEALVVDPATGDLYVLTKEGGDASTLFRAPASASGDADVTLEPVGSRDVRPDMVTAADVSADGTLLVVRTYFSVLLWGLPAGPASSTWSSALASEPCHAPVPSEIQGEAMAVLPDGSGLVSVSEGATPAVHLVRP